MRRFLPLWLCVVAAIFLAGQSFGQLTSTGAGKKAGGGGGGRTCSDSTASGNFLARTSGLSDAGADAYCEMIKGLETDSIITGNLGGATSCGSILDGFYIFATNSNTTANLNICGTSYGLSASGSPSFTAGQGYTGNGASTVLATGFAPLTAGGNFAQNSAHLGVYIRTSRTSGQQYAAMGCSGFGGFSSSYIIPKWSDNNYYLSLNQLSGDGATNTNVQGQWISTRTSSSAVAVYQNGNTTPFNSASTASVANCDSVINILSGNQDGVGPNNFTTDQLSAAYFGAGLSSGQMANLTGRINTYMTTLGVNVY